MQKATKYHKNILLLGSTIVIGTVNSSSGNATIFEHHVMKNESLSKILKGYGFKHLYGKNGFIKKVSQINKEKIKNNGNLIHIGAVIKIPRIKVVNPILQKVLEEPLAEIKPEQLKVESNREPSDEYPYSEFGFSLHATSMNIDSTNDTNFGGTNVNALSNKGAKLNVDWSVYYNETFSFMGFAAFDYYTFTNDPAFIMNRKNITRLHYGTGLFYNYSPDFNLNSKISMRQISFLDVTSPSTVNLETLGLTEMSLGLQKGLAVKKQFKLDFMAHASFLLAGSSGRFTSKPGYGLGSSLEMSHKQKSLLIHYDLRSVKINEIKNKERIIGLGMNFKI